MAKQPTSPKAGVPTGARGERGGTGHPPEGREPPARRGSGPGTAQVLALLGFGVVAFNFPILSLLAHRAGDIPWLWIGLFGFWALFIVLIRILHRDAGRARDRA